MTFYLQSHDLEYFVDIEFAIDLFDCKIAMSYYNKGFLFINREVLIFLFCFNPSLSKRFFKINVQMHIHIIS